MLDTHMFRFMRQDHVIGQLCPRQKNWKAGESLRSPLESFHEVLAKLDVVVNDAQVHYDLSVRLKEL